jgi:hypothetical protein
MMELEPNCVGSFPLGNKAQLLCDHFHFHQQQMQQNLQELNLNIA